jgi:hypothetical protein
VTTTQTTQLTKSAILAAREALRLANEAPTTAAARKCCLETARAALGRPGVDGSNREVRALRAALA